MGLGALLLRGTRSIPAIVLGLALAAVGAVLAWRVAPCADFHVGTQFSGSNDRLGRWIGRCKADLGAARSTLAVELLLICGYALALGGILRRWWPRLQASWLVARTNVVVALPLVVAGLDLVENAATALALGRSATRGGFAFTYPDNYWLPTVVSTAAWLKTFGFAIAVLLALMALGVAFARRHEPDDLAVVTMAADSEPPAPLPEPAAPAGLGVCCSGGGVRAAAYALGAIDELERAGVMERARWLAAVSGGNYAATSWTLARATDPARPAARDVISWLDAPIPYSTSGRHRFLRNGPGGLGRSLIAAACYIALNLAVLAALVAVLAWPLGRVIGSEANQPQMRLFHRLPSRLEVPTELWLPGLGLAGVAAVVLLASALPLWRVSSWWRVAAGLAAVAIGLEVLLVGVPYAMVTVANWLHADHSSGRVVRVSATALTGTLGIAWQLVRQPVLTRVTKNLPRLGGVLLAVAGIVWGGKVATDAATGAGMFAGAERWLVTGAVFVALYATVGVSTPSIHRIYRRRLLRTFGLHRHPETGAVGSPGTSDGQLTWSQLPEAGPELVVCCAQQRRGIAHGGLPADSFTISRHEVRNGEVVVDTAGYLERLPKDLASERYVAAWTATSGAAFASAMGRMSQGSTNALLAALNIDLGIWLPNPRLTSDPRMRFPKVRYGYLLKEILGWYDVTDRFLFVADGGHWDNLGLVELLRRRAATIVCIDASGDEPGSFTALRQAIEVAGLELPDIVEHVELDGLAPLSGSDGMLPPSTVATLTVRYAGGHRGTLLYAKAQVAADLPVELRRFAKADISFPNYSTANQFLTNEQFRRLVALGHAAGEALVRCLGGHDQPPAQPDLIDSAPREVLT